jgi:hypothetical protein
MWPRQPAFRIREDEVIESYPSFFWIVGHFVQPVQTVRPDLPIDVLHEISAGAKQGLRMFLSQPLVPVMLPVSSERARRLEEEVDHWRAILDSDPHNLGNIVDARVALRIFSQSVQDELDRIPSFTMTPKGSLSIHALTNGVSKSYPKFVAALIDQFIANEIDEAGKCLACNRATACGFHILRSVETSVKGYVLAATGKLPPMRHRNWGEYLDILSKVTLSSGTKVSDDLIDALRVLKGKRNPLMHPAESLEEHEAISLLCICQATHEALIADVVSKALDTEFKKALAALPTT